MKKQVLEKNKMTAINWPFIQTSVWSCKNFCRFGDIFK